MVFEMRYRAIPMTPTQLYGIVKSNIVCTQSKIFHEFVSGLVFSFCAERTTLFNLHTWTPHLEPQETRCGTKKIFWHEESIVLQLSFFLWYQTVRNQVVPTRNGWSRSWVPGEDPKRTWRSYSWMWEICVLADVDVLFFNLKDVQTGIFRWKPSRKIKNMLNS